MDVNGVRGVLFDKDGTLFDFQRTWGPPTRGLIEAEALGDADRARALASVLGYDMATARFLPGSIVVAEPADVVAAAVLPLLRDTDPDAFAARMNAWAAGVRQVPVTPLGPLFARLCAAELRLGVATNDAERAARRHLVEAGIETSLAFIAGYDSGFGAKPEAGQLAAFARATGLAPQDCAMIGDSLHDLHAARAAGMVAVAVLTGVADEAELAPAADVVLASVADLPGWLGL